MNKKGFTLSEILITFGIIGVIAAITLSSFHFALPDKDKGRVLNAYNALLAANNEMFSNPSLYDSTSPNARGGKILSETENPQDGNHTGSNYKSDDKYPYLLGEHLTLASGITKKSNEYTFQTSDGITWMLTANRDNNGDMFYKILLDMGYSELSRQCVYSAACTNPGRYGFVLDAYGQLTASDNLTKAFLLNPNKLNDRAADLKKASEL